MVGIGEERNHKHSGKEGEVELYGLKTTGNLRNTVKG